MTSPLLSLPGAVAADPPDAGVAAHYGDPMREQRALAESRTGFVDLSHRGVVTVSGPDRLDWLNNLTTQLLLGLPAGASTTALLLSPNGHVEQAYYAVDDGTTFWMHLEPGAAPAVVAFLDKMRFMARVEVSDRTAEFAVAWTPAPVEGDTWPVRSGVDSLGGFEHFLPRASELSFGAPAGMWAYEALRIAARVPRLGLETDHRTIPNEVGWLESAVHMDKGCYRGQETVARVHNLGKPPRRLTFLHLDGSVDTLPAHGAPVVVNEREVGFVTSAARHYDLGPIALALLKRNVPVDVELLAGGVAAAQEVVVSPEAGLHVRARI
ncbi:folate-binding protein YgfZ [Tenggerimyces flavus]|nr:folate-binding protein YgfZ [Tenggerimyces flavus]